jgi:hypothetical protein
MKLMNGNSFWTMPERKKYTEHDFHGEDRAYLNERTGGPGAFQSPWLFPSFNSNMARRFQW